METWNYLTSNSSSAKCWPYRHGFSLGFSRIQILAGKLVEFPELTFKVKNYLKVANLMNTSGYNCDGL